MKEVQRWECRVATNANGRPYVDDIEYASGRYVLHSDHEAEVARLRADLQNAAKAALDATALACEKEREANANRLDAERWRHTRQQHGVTVSIEESDDDGDKQFVSGHSPEELDEAIDAAMGADA